MRPCAGSYPRFRSKVCRSKRQPSSSPSPLGLWKEARGARERWSAPKSDSRPRSRTPAIPRAALKRRSTLRTKASATVVFQVSSGPFVRIGEVIIAGLRRTHRELVAGVIRRAGVRTGEPMSRRKMLAAQRGLFELGLFRRAELAPMPGQEHREERNIVVACEEGEQKSYLFGVGYSNVDAARLILGWSHLNLLGRAYAFSAEVSLSQRQQRYSLSLRKQRVFGLPVPGYLAVYRTDEILGDRNVLRRGLWVDFGDRLKRPLRPWLRYEYEITEPEPFPSDADPRIEDTVLETKVASVTPSIEWDTRDNPLAPIRGIYALASLQYAFPAFQAEANFLKFSTGGTVYSPIFRGFGAIGLRLGAIKPHQRRSGLPAESPDPICLSVLRRRPHHPPRVPCRRPRHPGPDHHRWQSGRRQRAHPSQPRVPAPHLGTALRCDLRRRR